MALCTWTPQRIRVFLAVRRALSLTYLLTNALPAIVLAQHAQVLLIHRV